MNTSYRVALLGFSDFERATLDAFFRLTTRRAVQYQHEAELAQAELLLVDSDLPGLLADPRLAGRPCVCIGAEAVAGALLHLPRPLNMMALLRQLDAKLTLAPTAQAAAPPLAPTSVAPPPPSSAARHDDGPPTQPQDRQRRRVSSMDDILVVDDSDIALRFMAEVLGRYGFDVHLARSGEEALRRVAEQHFEFVFLDVNMPGMNGHQTCKLIKNSPYYTGRLPPTVVMLTSRGAMADRLRGTLAGCDAYLTKPLQREALLKVVGDRIVAESAQAETEHDTLSENP